jgi:hypothetical protein
MRVLVLIDLRVSYSAGDRTCNKRRQSARRRVMRHESGERELGAAQRWIQREAWLCHLGREESAVVRERRRKSGGGKRDESLGLDHFWAKWAMFIFGGQVGPPKIISYFASL